MLCLGNGIVPITPDIYALFPELIATDVSSGLKPLVQRNLGSSVKP